MNVTLHGNVAELVNKQTELGHYESPEDLVYEAMQALVREKIDQGIERGIQDVKEGRVTEVNRDNIKEFLTNL